MGHDGYVALCPGNGGFPSIEKTSDQRGCKNGLLMLNHSRNHGPLASSRTEGEEDMSGGSEGHRALCLLSIELHALALLCRFTFDTFSIFI